MTKLVNAAERSNAREYTAQIIARSDRDQLATALELARKMAGWCDSAGRAGQCTQLALDLARERVAALESALRDLEYAV